jgi:hypothetical protein
MDAVSDRGTGRNMAKSASEQLLALEGEKAKLVEAARIEFVEKIDLNLTLLKGLGFHYKLVEVRNPSAPCPICGFRTDKPHNARAHRWQEPKAPFTDGELARRGMRRI